MECGIFELNGVRVSLPESEWKVARCLLNARGRVVQRERIAQELWGSYMQDPGRAIDAHVYRLRKRLAIVPGLTIETIRQRGFRMTVGERTPAGPAPVL